MIDIKEVETQMIDLEKCKKTATILTAEDFNITKLQKTNPLFSTFFNGVVNGEGNGGGLNHRYEIVDLEMVRLKSFPHTLFAKPVFIKYSPLLDTLKYMTGKYDDTPEMLKDFALDDTKYGDLNNASYIDGLFCFLSSRLLNDYGVLNAIDFYGSYLGVQEYFKTNIMDDLEYLNSFTEFTQKMAKGEIICEEFLKTLQQTNNTRGYKPKMIFEDLEEMTAGCLDLDVLDCEDGINNNNNPAVISVDDGEMETIYEKHGGDAAEMVDEVDDAAADNDDDDSRSSYSGSSNNSVISDTSSEGEETEYEDLDEDDSEFDSEDEDEDDSNHDKHHDKHPTTPNQKQPNVSNGNLSHKTTCGFKDAVILEKKGEMRDEDSESGSGSSGSGSSGSGSSDDNSCSEEEDNEELTAYIKDYPVQLICLEKCLGTLDELFCSGLAEKETVCMALLCQVVMTLAIYQKAFHFTHNDLHTNNIMFVATELDYVYYIVGGKYYCIPTYGKIMKIIDFGRSIYHIGDKKYTSDGFSPTGDANTQYNTEPYFNEKKPRIEENPSFDLCRLGCSIYDFVFDEDDEAENNKNPNQLSLLKQMVLKWCLDDAGKNILYKRSGSERYPNFKLYKMIARLVHHNTPADQMVFFGQYEMKPEIAREEQHLPFMNIDELPAFYAE